ncbi:hypothetical protein DRQ12_02190, partial [candidate division KSB1 bacterium]
KPFIIFLSVFFKDFNTIHYSSPPLSTAKTAYNGASGKEILSVSEGFLEMLIDVRSNYLSTVGTLLIGSVH